MHRGAAAPRSDDASSLRGNSLLTLATQAFDLDLHYVAGLQEPLRFHAHPDARRGAGGDDITRHELHEAAHVADDLTNVNDHVAGVRILNRVTVAIQRHPQGLRISDLVCADEIGADGAEGRCGLALDPLALTFDLEFPFCHVIDGAIGRDVV